MKKRMATAAMTTTVDTQDSEDNEEISGDADDPLNLDSQQIFAETKGCVLIDQVGMSEVRAPWTASYAEIYPVVVEKKRRQSAYQRFVNRRYSPHEPVPSMRKPRSEEQVKQGYAQVVPDYEQEKKDNEQDAQDESYSVLTFFGPHLPNNFRPARLAHCLMTQVVHHIEGTEANQ
ncbi:hypothetical protein GN244_ATG17307 [Phytophthora infestans]|uniref:Uncharacterized protein n=1 Tax=Phytophthora infestans TaxID=4787 RepID=A0A833SSN0_PHYIN|nr:hypothetical protein GN244_ATG17307 [Phytophthora infestans]KAF4132229.1 hypothetical protein GN958_ATG18581 [Phytophthora infestans]